MKKCLRCERALPLSEYYREARTKDGLTRWCKLCRKEALRAWRKSNPEKFREQWRRWVRNNRAANVAKTRRWEAKNPEKARQYDREYEHRRRARMKRVPSEYFSREEIYGRDGGRCHICKKKVAKGEASIDHLVPISAGGPNTKDNVALAHTICNIRRGAYGTAQLRLVG